MWRISSSTTCMPSRSRRRAVVSPTIPPPTTTTSAAMSRSSGGLGVASLPSSQSERSTLRGYPVSEPATPGHEIGVVGSKQLVVASLALLVPLAACGTSHRGSDAGAVVERFHAALGSGDGAGACHELSEETVSKLEQQEGKPCAKAILGMKLPTGGTA